tara:strand:- start:4477 stop:5241 length:765 start_codon:yes stop_codon:yes gene_type:complete
MTVPAYNITTNVAEFRRGLTRVQRDQLPYATFLAVNETAVAAVQHNQRAMARLLDRPKPFTVRGLYPRKGKYRRGNRSAGLGVATAEASLMWRAFAAGGTAAGRYLQPQVFGRPRGPKRHETLLRNRGLLGPGQYLVPAPGQRLNQYGNLPKATYVRLLSAVSASTDPGQNRTTRSAGRNTRRRDFFVPKRGGKLSNGVWERKASGQIKPVLIEVRQPQYRRRYDFFGLSENFVRQQLPISMRAAMARAIRTAR